KERGKHRAEHQFHGINGRFGLGWWWLIPLLGSSKRGICSRNFEKNSRIPGKSSQERGKRPQGPHFGTSSGIRDIDSEGGRKAPFEAARAMAATERTARNLTRWFMEWVGDSGRSLRSRGSRFRRLFRRAKGSSRRGLPASADFGKN